MEGGCNDPYEQQLYAVFQSCLKEGQAGLEEDGLHSLCDKLQLDEPSKRQLLASLFRVTNSKSKGKSQSESDLELELDLESNEKRKGRNGTTATFQEFREGLLAFLEQKSAQIVTDSDTKSDHVLSVLSRDSMDTLELHRVGKKPIQRIHFDKKFGWSDFGDWRRLCPNVDVDIPEIFVLSHCIGIPTLPKQTIEQIFAKLDLNCDGLINLDEFFLVFRNGRNFHGQLEFRTESKKNDVVVVADKSKNNSVSVSGGGGGDFRAFGSYETGYTRSSSSIVDLWEVAGILDAGSLLLELGFTSSDINLTDLTSVLCEELKALRDESASSTHVNLLRATLAIYQEEIRNLTAGIEQLQAERDKFRLDSAEANERANLLAQEIDEQHLQQEKSKQEQLRQLEAKHAELVKELSGQLSSERESNCARLESARLQLQQLQAEEQRLRGKLAAILSENQGLETENQRLCEHVAKLKTANSELMARVQMLVAEHDEVTSEEVAKSEQMISLVERIKQLQSETVLLRDQNDELTMELENLRRRDFEILGNSKNSQNCKNSQHSQTDVKTQENWRSSEEPSQKRPPNVEDDDDDDDDDDDLRFNRISEIERLLRDFENPNPSRPNGLWRDSSDGCCCGRSSSLVGTLPGRIAKQMKAVFAEPRTKNRCRYKIAVDSILDALEGSLSGLKPRNLLQNSAPSGLKTLASELEAEDERNGAEALRDFAPSGSKPTKRISAQNLRDYPPRKEDSAPECASRVQASPGAEKEQEQELERKHALERKQLLEQCSELEKSLELLKTEYEQCEDYWAAKLEEERQLFEQEQKISDEKFAELIGKIAEYEELFSGDKQKPDDGRLSPIEERFQLEQQYADLEEEFEKWRLQSQLESSEKDEELKSLRDQIASRQIQHTLETRDASIQVPLEKSLECQPASTPFSSRGSTRRFQLEAGEDQLENNNPTNYGKRSKTFGDERQLENLEQLERIGERNLEYLSALKREKDRLVQEVLELQSFKSSLKLQVNPSLENSDGLQECNSGVVQKMSRKLQLQEQKRKHLQMLLKRQQKYTGKMLQQTWKQHQNEVSSLQVMLRATQEKLQQQIRVNGEQAQKLEEVDFLTKELFMENADLLASVKQLQQHCEILSHSSNNNNSLASAGTSTSV